MEFACKILLLLTPTERKQSSFVFCMMLLGVLMETFSVGLVIPALALMTQHNPGTLKSLVKFAPSLAAALADKRAVPWAMVGLAMVFCVKSLFLACLAWLQTRFAYGVQARMSRQLLETYLTQPYTFHLQRNSAQLIFNTTTGVNLFTGAMLHGLTFMTEISVATALCSLLLSVEPLGTLAVAGTLGGVALLMHRAVSRRSVRWGECYKFHEGMRIQHIQQSLGGIKDVLLLGRETEFTSRYAVHNEQSTRMARYQVTFEQLPRLVLEALAVAGLAALVIMMLAQGKDISAIVPTIGLFATAAFRLMPSVNRILLSLQSLKYHKSAVLTLHDEFTRALPAGPSPTTVESRHAMPPLQRQISAENIIFRYPGAERPALTGINLTIEKGTSIGLIGSSGSGKSTLVDVLLGLLKPEAGQVRADDQDIQADVRAWQRQIGYVPQTIFLTDESLRENIALGVSREDIDDVAVERALAAAQLTNFVAELPEGLNTRVGERGVRLSGGQRQRIGIARALYHDPNVLVLDEATSALDTDTEADVMQAINALHGQKTIVIVAHRTSTVSQCDCLYRLENGRIAANGDPRNMI